MSVSVEKLENSMAKLTVEVSAEEFDKAIDGVYKQQRGRISVPGFRKGKAPRAIIEKMYGKEIFYEDAANNAMESSYPAAVDECGEEVVSDPSIEIVQLEAGKPFIYAATVALKPPVGLGKYKGVEVAKRTVEVTDADVDAEVDRERAKNATYEDITDRPVRDGDMITLDFEGFVDGVAFEGGKGEDYPLTVGSNSFIPGFEPQLVGMGIGEEKEISVKFPEDYHAEELKGKDATFKCTVKTIRERRLPEADDAFADEVSEFSTMAEYRDSIRADLMKRRGDEARAARENDVIEAIVADSHIEIPEAMLRTQQRQMVNEFAQRLQMQGLSMEQYTQYTGQTADSMFEEMKPEAERRIRTRLVLEQIVKDENIAATEEDLEAELQKLADAYKIDVDTVKKTFGDRQREDLGKDIAVQKAVTFVTENAVETEKKEEKKEG